MAFDPARLAEAKAKFDPGKLAAAKSGDVKTGPSDAARTVSKLARPVLEVGGAGAGAALVGGGSAPSVAGVVPAAVAGGALGFAAGRRAADMLDEFLGIKEPIQSIRQAVGETGEAIKAGAEAESLGLLMRPVFAGVANVARPVARKLMSRLFDVSEGALSAMYRRPQDIKTAKSLEEVASDAASALKGLDQETRALDDKAWDSLLKLRAEPRSKILNILKDVRKGIKIEGGETVGKADAKALQTIDDLIADVSKIKEKGVDPSLDQMLTQPQIRKIIQSADANINWDDPMASRTNEALADFRTKLSNYLKESNPQYEKIMGPLAERMRVIKDMARVFAIGKEEGVWTPKDTATSRMKLATKPGRTATRAAASDFKDMTGEDVVGKTRDAMFAEEFAPKAGTGQGRALRDIFLPGGPTAETIVGALAKIRPAGDTMLSPAFRRVLSAAAASRFGAGR